MKDRFPTTETNTAVAKLRGVSLLSDGLRQWEFYLPFREYTRSYRKRNSQERISLVRERQASEVRDAAETLAHAPRAYCGENSLVSLWKRN